MKIILVGHHQTRKTNNAFATIRHKALGRFVYAKKIIILHGAGVSIQAGLPPYTSLTRKERECLDYDLYKRSDQSQSLLFQIWQASLHYQPTLYHLFLQALYQTRTLHNVFTFNIDGLESMAAKLPSDVVTQLHGTTHLLHCSACHTMVPSASALPKRDMLTLPQHSCTFNRRRPRKVQASQQKLHFHVRLYGQDPCADLFPQEMDATCKASDKPLLIISGCALRNAEQKHIAKTLIRQVHNKDGNTIIINPDTPPASVLNICSSILHLPHQIESFAEMALMRMLQPFNTTNQAPTYVATSKIPNAGNGLFASHFIPTNTKLMYYTGQHLNQMEMNALYGNGVAVYVFKVSDNHFIDARDPKKSNHARYINTIIPFHIDNEKRFNVYFEVEDDIAVVVRTSRDIEEGEELLASYGDEYHIEI